MRGKNRKSSAFIVVLMCAAVCSVTAGASAPYPGIASTWQDFACVTFDMDGRDCTLVKPETPAAGSPWLLRANAPDSESALDRMLLERGFHIAWMDVEPLYGNAAAVEHWNALYAWARETLKLAAKPALAGNGPGSLLLYNWAAQRSEQVACIYAEAPWLQLHPTSNTEQDEALLQQVMAAHGIADPEKHDEATLGNASTLGSAEIPMMHLYGERRPGVVPNTNIEQFYAAYRLAGKGEYESLNKPTAATGSRHDTNVAALLFLLKHTGQLPDTPVDTPIAAMPEWKVADFAGHNAVRVLGDILILEHGNDMTGITCVEEPLLLNYEIMLDAMRLSGGDFFCGLTAPYKDTSFSLVVGGWGGTCVGISSLDWLDAYHNETARFRSFDDHRWYRIRLRVTEDTIQAWIDGEETVNVSVADRSVDIRWEMAPTQPLGIATWRTTSAIKNFSVRPIAELTAADDPL